MLKRFDFFQAPLPSGDAAAATTSSSGDILLPSSVASSGSHLAFGLGGDIFLFRRRGDVPATITTRPGSSESGVGAATAGSGSASASMAASATTSTSGLVEDVWKRFKLRRSGGEGGEGAVVGTAGEKGMKERGIAHLYFTKRTNILVSVEVEGKSSRNVKVCVWSTSRDHHHRTCLAVLDISEMASKMKERPPWDHRDKIWPSVTCVSALEDISQIALGLSNGFTFLIRGDSNLAAEEITVMQSCRMSIIPPPSFQPRPEIAVSSIDHHINEAYSMGDVFLPVTGLGFLVREEPSKSSMVHAVWLWVVSGPDRGGLRAFNTASISADDSRSKTAESNTIFNFFSILYSYHHEIIAGPLLDSQGCSANCACVFPINQKFERLTSASEPGKPREQKPAGSQEFFAIGKVDRIALFTPEDPGACYSVMGEKRHILWFRTYLCVVSLDSPIFGMPGATASADFTSPSQGGVSETIQVYDFQDKFIALSYTIYERREGRVLFVAFSHGVLYVITSRGMILQFVEKDMQQKLQDLVRRNLFLPAISIAHSSHCDLRTVVDLFRAYGDHLYEKRNYDDAIAQYARTVGYVEPSYVIQKFLDSSRIGNLTIYLEALHLQHGKPTGDHTTLLLNCYIKQKREAKIREFIRNEEFTIDVTAALSVLRQAHYFEDALYLADANGAHDTYLCILLEDMKAVTKALEYIQKLEYDLAAEFCIKHGKALISSLPDETTSLIKSLFATTWRDQTIRLQPLPPSFSLGDATPGVADLDTIKLVQNPDNFFPIFVDHPVKLEEFLFYVVNTLADACTSTLVWNTLLELRLTSFTSSKDSAFPSTLAKPAMASDVMQILKDPKAHYDSNHALVLVQQHEFKEGQLYLYEKFQMYEMLIQYYMDINDGLNVIQMCKKHGPQDPNLWIQVLIHFAKHPEQNEHELRQVLHHIEWQNILPPLLVIQILSSNPNVQLSTVRSYITGQLERSLKSIEDDDVDIKQLRDDTERMKAEAKALRTEPQIFKSTRCGLTGAPLEFPTVHFLTGNSYNLNSLPGGSGAQLDNLEDPKHAAEQHTTRDILIGLQKRSAEKAVADEEFFGELESSQDGFSVIANALGYVSFIS